MVASGDDIDNSLDRIVSDSINSDDFKVDEFLRKWFRSEKNNSGSFYFLFSVNLKVTNIQFSELLSLLRVHTTSNDKSSSPIQFSSTKEFRENLSRLWNSLGRPKLDTGEQERKKKFFIDYYKDLFFHTIIVDCYFGSASVHIPNSLNIDIKNICAESGYIYACGRLIYLTNSDNASLNLLRENLNFFIEKNASGKTSISFNTFSHEQFSKTSTVSRDESHQGMEEIKVYLDRFYFENTPIFDVLLQLREEYQKEEDKKLIFILPPSFEDEVRENEVRDFEKTIWLLVEKSIMIVNSDSYLHGDDRYFVVYAQEFRNKNHFVIFNEKKPGWIAPATLPHTLAAAMLNLTRPYWPNRQDKSRKISIVDPFGGTGTTALEALKLSDSIEFFSYDKHPIYKVVAEDNLTFFKKSFDELKELRKSIEKPSPIKNIFSKNIFSISSFGRKKLPTKYDDAVWAFHAYRREIEPYTSMPTMEQSKALHSHSFSEDFISDFKNQNFIKRLFFYLCWRAVSKNLFALRVDLSKDEDVIVGEIEEFKKNLNKLIDRYDPSKLVEDSKHICTIKGDYSNCCIFRLNDSTKISFGSEDAYTVFEGGKEFDLIITDPPYGFNVDVGSALELAALYKNIVPKMIESLSNNGQLIFCLPATSHNGQIIPAFATSKFVIHSIFATVQLYCAEHQKNLEIIQSAFTHPYPSDLFEPPYYWESPVSLRRYILHFRIRASTD